MSAEYDEFKMPSLSERINKLYSLLMKHRERYVRAWMAYYKADPSLVHLVTQFTGSGEVMRMEYRRDTDAVDELVKAASDLLAELKLEPFNYERESTEEAEEHLRATLKPFER